MRVLNVGSGEDDYGTDRIDLFKTINTTKVYDIEKGLPYKDNTFEEVYCRHVLEHMDKKKIKRGGV